MKVTAAKIVKEYGTNDPFIIAKKMDINVFLRPLVDIGGYYMLLNDNVRVAVIDKCLPRHLQKFVLALEIGHGLLHPEKCALMFSVMPFATDCKEVEADRFAINLLITDKMIETENKTVDEWASILGLPRKVIELRWN